MRKVIATLESYQPVRDITARALRCHRDDKRMSISTLRAELERMDASPIVLNRGLREAVQKTIAQQGLSMNEIAIRCGRFKRDSRGHTFGDTSWLARRVACVPTPANRSPRRGCIVTYWRSSLVAVSASLPGRSSCDDR